MIVYQADKATFLNDVITNTIEKRILHEFELKLKGRTGQSEINSWKNSMMYMQNVLMDAEIPDDCGVAIEYKIPLTSKRVDFILSGKNQSEKHTAVIIELKQWSSAKKTAKDGIVVSFVGGAERELNHPSYQAWSYASVIQDFNETIHNESIPLHPCAYLHNLEDGESLKDKFYDHYTAKAPVFLREDMMKLRAFIKRHVKHGDQSETIYKIDAGRIRPAKSLADRVSSLLKGNPEFILLDEQKIVFEAALAASRHQDGRKRVLIVEGGPGTGKTVVAMNLLATLLGERLNAQYVTKNAAPRSVYEVKLTGDFKKSSISNLFSGSGAFTKTEASTFDTLLIDEAHRLNEKSGMFQNQGENQIKELIHASQCSVFFIDEDQRVSLKDIGTVGEIERWAAHFDADVQRLVLPSQFRCNGSDGYLAWLDHVLQIRETANETLEGIDYDFRVVDSPSELRSLITERNKASNKARMVAGYCWDWVSKKNPNSFDIELENSAFRMRWNLADDGMLWILGENSVDEIGCIHTCQGLELDYVGVILGPDIFMEGSHIQTDMSARSKNDSTTKGYKKLLVENRYVAQEMASLIIKNTYRTLMTRGQKGCYVYCVNPALRNYLQLSMRSC